MSRLTAWVVLVAALGLIYSLAFTTYDHQTNRWRTTESGGLTRVTVECPSPIAVLLFDSQPAEAGDRTCDASSRTLAFEAGFVALAAGLLVWKPVSRHRPTPIEPLSKLLRRSGDSGRG